MAYDKDLYSPVVAYLPRPLKTRMERIQQHDRRYKFTRIIEESLLAHLPVLEATFGIKSPKAKKEA